MLRAARVDCLVQPIGLRPMGHKTGVWSHGLVLRSEVSPSALLIVKQPLRAALRTCSHCPRNVGISVIVEDGRGRGPLKRFAGLAAHEGNDEGNGGKSRSKVILSRNRAAQYMCWAASSTRAVLRPCSNRSDTEDGYPKDRSEGNAMSVLGDLNKFGR